VTKRRLIPVSAAADEDDWQLFAVCKGKTHLFYEAPRESEQMRFRRESLAKRYCAACPVTEICRLNGRLGREHGVWGGETDEERAAAGFLPMRSTSRRIRAAYHGEETSPSGAA